MRLPCALALLAAFPTGASAFSRGVSFHGCDGCHGEGTQTMELEGLAPFVEGVEVELALRVVGDGEELGLYVSADGGTLRAGGGTQRSGTGLTHAGPQPFDGDTTLRFRWVPERGATRFVVSTLTADGNNGRGGDGGASAEFNFVVGCEAATFYQDQDNDGFGGERTRIFCEGEPDAGFVAVGGDCDDFRPDVYPDAEEPCNQRDDNCNGIVDDDAEEVVHYPDADGDGFYSRDERSSGEEFFGCSEPGGPWAARFGDCAPDDPERNPDAEEVCDLLDNDCDLEVDERVRPQCGVGWCRRNANSCDPEDCEPGPPTTETCNLLDDDCDGQLDEGTCPEGQACIDFECQADDAGDAGTDTEGEHVDASSGCASTQGNGWAMVLVALLVLQRRKR